MSDLGSLILGLLMILLIIGGVVALGYGIDKYRCGEMAAAMRVEHSYSIWTRCMIRHRGQWIPLKNYRVLD